MIRSFGSKSTEHIWHEQYVKRVDRAVQRAALRKLELIHAAKDVEDAEDPAGSCLEQLIGDRQGAVQYPSQRTVAHLLHLERRKERWPDLVGRRQPSPTGGHAV